MLARTRIGRTPAWLLLPLLAVVAAVALGAGSAAIQEPAPAPAPAPVPTPAPAETNPQVRLTADRSDPTVTVRVTIDGPTHNADLYAFAFDLLLANPKVAQYIPGSAKAGSALQSGETGKPHVLAAQHDDRVTVGVTRLGARRGSEVAAGRHDVVSLEFRLLGPGATTLKFEGSPPNGPAALDSAGVVIRNVRFDPAPAVISGS